MSSNERTAFPPIPVILGLGKLASKTRVQEVTAFVSCGWRKGAKAAACLVENDFIAHRPNAGLLSAGLTPRSGAIELTKTVSFDECGPTLERHERGVKVGAQGKAAPTRYGERSCARRARANADVTCRS
jgi:hypothetical protein